MGSGQVQPEWAQAKFSPDGTLLAVAGGQPGGKGDLRIYRVADYALLTTMRGLSKPGCAQRREAAYAHKRRETGRPPEQLPAPRHKRLDARRIHHQREQ